MLSCLDIFLVGDRCSCYVSLSSPSQSEFHWQRMIDKTLVQPVQGKTSIVYIGQVFFFASRRFFFHSCNRWNSNFQGFFFDFFFSSNSSLITFIWQPSNLVSPPHLNSLGLPSIKVNTRKSPMGITIPKVASPKKWSIIFLLTKAL